MSKGREDGRVGRKWRRRGKTREEGRRRRAEEIK